LYNLKNDSVEIAPIYDCGSSLFPQADIKIMESVIKSESERNLRVYNIPLSAIKKDGIIINYFDFIYSLENGDCNEALKRIVPRIDINKIYKLIEDIPYISDIQKGFYKIMIKERKTKILDKSYDKLINT